MRLTIVLEQLLAPVPGGTGRWTRELAAALAAAKPEAWQLYGVVARHRDVRAALVPGVGGPVRLQVPGRVLPLLWEKGLPPLVSSDVVLAPTLLAPRPRQGQKLVAVIHDAVPWTHPGTSTARGVEFHTRAAEQVCRHAAAVLVPTHAVAAALADVLPGLPPVTVVGEGASVDVTVLPPDAAARAAALDLPREYLLTLATLEPRKDLRTAIAALAADPGGPPLLLVGQPGWGGVDPVALAAELGVAARVRVLGRLADADLAVVLARALALLVPSLAEGFGLPVVEAMAVGTPVVTSDDPALVEVGGGVPLVAPVGDVGAWAAAISRVRQPAEQARQRAQGPARAAHYSWKRTADTVWGVLLGV